MKKLILITTILLNAYFVTFSQQISVDERVFGLQAGLFGIWGHGEYKVQNKIAIKGELGFENGFSQTYNNNFYFFLIPTVVLEPRWYYNLEKRQTRLKRIDGNSGNYFSIFMRYHPDLFVISNVNAGSVIPDISIIPTWGFRRKISDHFNFEMALGLGYRYYFAKGYGYSSNKSETALNFTLRFGYIFK